jgi:hypothetical protein
VVDSHVSLGERAMSTLKCRKCSAVYPSSDKACPSCMCPARDLRPILLSGLLVAVVFIFGYWIFGGREEEPDTSMVSDSAVISRAFSAVRASLKDPSSADFGLTKRYSVAEGKNVACGTVNAKNSFGGYAGAKRFVYTHESASLVFDDGSPDFSGLWTSLCR